MATLDDVKDILTGYDGANDTTKLLKGVRAFDGMKNLYELSPTLAPMAFCLTFQGFASEAEVSLRGQKDLLDQFRQMATALDAATPFKDAMILGIELTLRQVEGPLKMQEAKEAEMAATAPTPPLPRDAGWKASTETISRVLMEVWNELNLFHKDGGTVIFSDPPGHTAETAAAAVARKIGHLDLQDIDFTTVGQGMNAAYQTILEAVPAALEAQKNMTTDIATHQQAGNVPHIGEQKDLNLPD